MDSIGNILLFGLILWQDDKLFSFDLAKPLNGTRIEYSRNSFTKWCNISETDS